MALHPVVRHAIADRQPPRIRGMKSGTVTVAIVVRLNIDPDRITRCWPSKEYKLILTARERTCLDPFQMTLFGNKDTRRTASLVINRRRAWLLSVTNSGIIVFTYSKIQNAR